MTEQREYTPEELVLIRQNCQKELSDRKVTDAEFDLFMYHVRTRQLDPLLNQIYFQIRGGKVVPIIGIDGARLCAARTGQYAGSDEPKFGYFAVPDTDKQLGKATVTVYRMVEGQRCAFTDSCFLAEYRASNTMWNKMPHSQLGKCCEMRALRKAFPDALAGMYIGEEMEQADGGKSASVPSPASQQENYETPDWIRIGAKARRKVDNCEVDIVDIHGELIEVMCEGYDSTIHHSALKPFFKRLEPSSAGGDFGQSRAEELVLKPQPVSQTIVEQIEHTEDGEVADTPAERFEGLLRFLDMTWVRLAKNARETFASNLLSTYTKVPPVSLNVDNLNPVQWNLMIGVIDRYLTATGGDEYWFEAENILDTLTSISPTGYVPHKTLYHISAREWKLLTDHIYTIKRGEKQERMETADYWRARFFAIAAQEAQTDGSVGRWNVSGASKQKRDQVQADRREWCALQLERPVASCNELTVTDWRFLFAQLAAEMNFQEEETEQEANRWKERTTVER